MDEQSLELLDDPASKFALGKASMVNIKNCTKSMEDFRGYF